MKLPETIHPFSHNPGMPGPLAAWIAANPYAWPGGYPVYAITDDGAALCPACCGTESDLIAESEPGDGWHVVAADVNWEDGSLYCDHCGGHIEAAYPNEEDQ